MHIFTTPITLIHHNHLWYCQIPANSTFCTCKYQRHTIFLEFSLKIWIYTISPFHDDPITSISRGPFILCFVSALRSWLILCFQTSFFISVVSCDYIVASYMIFFTCHNLYLRLYCSFEHDFFHLSQSLPILN